MIANSEQCCGNCAFWKLTEPCDADGQGVGICRRYPPVSTLTSRDVKEWRREGGLVNPSHDFIFWTQPRTMETTFCGEYLIV